MEAYNENEIIDMLKPTDLLGLVKNVGEAFTVLKDTVYLLSIIFSKVLHDMAQKGNVEHQVLLQRGADESLVEALYNE